MKKAEINSGRNKQRIVAEEDLDRFALRFVSLHSLANETGVYFRNLADKFRENGVQPAFDPKAVQASFYERIAVEDSVAQLTD